MTTFGSAIQVLLGDRYGRIIAEVEPRLGPISWRLNKVGKVDITFSKNDPKVTADNLRLANRVLIQFDNGLPAWGGVIDFPETWTRDELTVTALSGEHLLALRQTEKALYFTNVPIGYIFSKIITDANTVTDTGVSVGTVWGGGTTNSPEYHYTPLLDVIQTSLLDRLSTAEFYVRPYEEDGYIKFEANLYERRGADKPNVGLIEGHNITELQRVVQGPVVNSWSLAGADVSGDVSSGWGDGRLISSVQDADSITDYGFREGSEIKVDVKDQATLDNEADTLLDESKQPWNSIQMKAVNRAPALFASYDVGDRPWLESYSYGHGGFESLVRVEGREYFPETGAAQLLVSEVIDA